MTMKKTVTCARCGLEIEADPRNPGQPRLHFCPDRRPGDDDLPWPDTHTPTVDFTALAGQMSDALRLLTETARGYRAQLVQGQFAPEIADGLAADLLLRLHRMMFGGGATPDTPTTPTPPAPPSTPRPPGPPAIP